MCSVLGRERACAFQHDPVIDGQDAVQLEELEVEVSRNFARGALLMMAYAVQLEELEVQVSGNLGSGPLLILVAYSACKSSQVHHLVQHWGCTRRKLHHCVQQLEVEKQWYLEEQCLEEYLMEVECWSMAQEQGS